MPDIRHTRLADVLINYSIHVKPGDRVGIITQPIAMPLVEEVYRAVLRAGGFPYVQLGGLRSKVETENLSYYLLTEGTQEQIEHVNGFEKIIREEFECMVALYSQTNTRAMSGIDPAKLSQRVKAYTEVTRAYQQRSASKDLRWVLTLFPTDAYAQDAEMSLEEFENYVYATTFVDQEDPIAEWKKIHNEQQRLVDWLDGKKKIAVKGPNVDLSLSIDGRGFVNSDGEHNMPSGEIYTSPVEDSVEGWVRFSYPAIYSAREVEGVELTFENGKVVKALAQKNQEFLETMIAMDAGASYLGEFAIGTNKSINRFIKNILFDEKIGGTIHMALGFGFPEVGGKNESALHWDLICDMRDGGQILVDDELIYDSGEFKI
ncbi:MAG: aminopeptidase [Anaerolineales bacterium]|nr:MAG: aminopeptidase [Anaerolineales bacterium]